MIEKLVLVVFLSLGLTMAAILLPAYQIAIDLAAYTGVIIIFIQIIRGLPEPAPAPTKKDKH